MPDLEPRATNQGADFDRSMRLSKGSSRATTSKQGIRSRSDVGPPSDMEVADGASRTRSGHAQDSTSYWRSDRVDRHTVQLREDQLDESKRYGETKLVESRATPIRASDVSLGYPSSSASPFVTQSSSFSKQEAGLGQDHLRSPVPRFRNSKLETGLGQDSFQSPTPSWIAAQPTSTVKLVPAVQDPNQRELRSSRRAPELLLSTPRPEDHRRILASLEEVGDRLRVDGSALNDVSIKVIDSPKLVTERPHICSTLVD